MTTKDIKYLKETLSRYSQTCCVLALEYIKELEEAKEKMWETLVKSNIDISRVLNDEAEKAMTKNRENLKGVN